MENLSPAAIDLQPLIAEFPSMQFMAFTSSNKSIVSFACYASTDTEIIDNWQSLQNLIAGIYQACDRRAMWNYYLALFCNQKVSIREIYRIQNDKFCCRKLIYSTYQLPFTTETIQHQLSQDILGSSLEIKRRDQPAPYLSSLATELTDVPLSHSLNDKTKRRLILKKLVESVTR